MQIEEALYNELSSDSIAAPKLAAGNGQYHLYPLRVPEGVLPERAITYTEIDQTLTYPTVRTSIYQLSCIAKTFADARALADDVDRIFNHRYETMLGGVAPVKYVKFQGRSQLRDNDSKLYIIPVELLIKY